MDGQLRQLVIQRAEGRCEYCLMPQRSVQATFHLEHIVAKQHGGDDDAGNIALACDRCNLFKRPNLTSLDTESGKLTVLFHPRQHVWTDHFECRGATIVGKTAIGNATVRLLQMNASARRRARAAFTAWRVVRICRRRVTQTD